MLKIPFSSLHDHMLPVQPQQSDFASGKPLSLSSRQSLHHLSGSETQTLMIFGTVLLATTAGNELLLHPPRTEERGKCCAWQRNKHNNFNSECNLNTQKANFAASNQPEPGSGFPDRHDFIRPDSNFDSRAQPATPCEAQVTGVQWDTTILESQGCPSVPCAPQGPVHGTRERFWELCLHATATFSTVRVSSPPRNSQSLKLAAVSKSFPGGIATPIAQSCSS